MAEKTVISQDAKFIYYADGSKDSLDDYRKSKGLPSIVISKEKEYKKYREDNKQWLDEKAKGKLKGLDDIK